MNSEGLGMGKSRVAVSAELPCSFLNMSIVRVLKRLTKGMNVVISD